jgi:hypothetical protein
MHNSESNEYLCRVCGWHQNDPPWGGNAETPSFEICDCCGVEFGYEDATSEGVIRFRKLWLAEGAPWFDEFKMPAKWDLSSQLERLGIDTDI